MLQPFPSIRDALVNEVAEHEMAWVMQFILGIRKIKGEMNIAPGKPVPVMLANSNETDRELGQTAPPLPGFSGPHRIHRSTIGRVRRVRNPPQP